MSETFLVRYRLANRKMTRCMFGKETEYERKEREFIFRVEQLATYTATTTYDTTVGARWEWEHNE